MNNDNAGRVLAIALDAAEPSLIEKWIGDGSLVNLNRLRSLGAYGRLDSSAKWLSGSPWPTFYTGTSPAEHGLYETKQWRAELMQTVQVDPSWLPLTPFWRTLDSHLRVVSIDVPLTYTPQPFNGIEICGWMTHDSISNSGKPCSYPTNEINCIAKKYGLKPVEIKNERWGLQNAKTLLGLKDQLVEGTRTLGKLAKTLLNDEKWDLFIANFAAPHRGGHVLWDLSGTYGRTSAKDKKAFSTALKEIYVECDKAIGELVKSLDETTNVLIFSLHGMQSNNNRSYVLPSLLEYSLKNNSSKSQQKPKALSYLVNKTKNMVPPLIRSIALPNSISTKKDLLSTKLRNSSKGSVGEAFELLSFQSGFIRINLKGREKDGVLKPDKEYDDFCSKLIDNIENLTDQVTGKQIIEKCIKVNELYKAGSRLNYLPDIIVRWNTCSCLTEHRIISRKNPQLSISVPKRNLDGRSGNHTSQGFLIAIGKNFYPNSRVNNADITDLAPTICHLLNIQKTSCMKGKTITVSEKVG